MIVLLSAIILFCLALELGLRILDPWGMAYFDDQATLQAKLARLTNRVSLQPGRYTLHNWQVVQREDFTRRVPGSRGGKCHITFIGDSVTWGQGVSDAQTWVSLVAQALPFATVQNAAFSGADSNDVMRSVRDFAGADALVYLIIYNDVDDKAHPWSPNPPSGYLGRYLYAYLGVYKAPPPDWPRFWADMAVLQADPRIVLVAFDDAFGAQVAARLNVHLIPPYTERLAVVDSHPNAMGHRQIADAILPVIRSTIGRCPIPDRNYLK